MVNDKKRGDILKKRIDYIDIAKGIGILLMVIGHSLSEDSKLRSFIYLFHMPLFFFISGVVFNELYFQDTKALIKSKLKGLWYPFIKYSIIFIFLHNLFVSFHIFENQGVTAYYNIISIIKNIIRALFFMQTDWLLCQLWFLWILFLSEVVFGFLGNFIARITKENFNKILGLVCFLFFLIGMFLSIKEIKLPNRISTFFVSIFFIYLGYMYSKIKEKIQYRVGIFLIVLSILLISSIDIKIAMVDNYYSNHLLFLPLSLMGIYIIFYISINLKKNKILKNIFSYLGRNTLIILALHFLCFKIVTFSQILFYRKSLKLLSNTILYSNGIWWICYSVVGILIPLVINKVCINLKNIIVNNTKKV